MGSVGDCDDHAVAERCFATLKGELLDREGWPTRAAARAAIFAYLEGWYNRQRRHSTLGYRSPAAFEAGHHCAQRATSAPSAPSAASAPSTPEPGGASDRQRERHGCLPGA